MRFADEMNLIDDRTAATTAITGLNGTTIDTDALQNDKDVTAAGQTHTRVPGHYYYNRFFPIRWRKPILAFDFFWLLFLSLLCNTMLLA